MKNIVNKLILAGASGTLALTSAYLIIPFEGEVVNEKGNHVVYKDIVGINTACWGQTGADLDGRKPSAGVTYTQEYCEKWYLKELIKYNKAMKKHVKVELKPYEEVAYTSFVWNVGETNFKNSTLLKKLNSGDRVGACNELPRWNKAGGVVVKGLTNRRLHEQKVCLGKDEAVNAALSSLLVQQEAPETFISTSQGVDEGEPVSTLVEPINEPEVSIPDVIPEAPVEKCWKFLWFCLK